MIRSANMEIEGAVLEHSSLPEVFAACASTSVTGRTSAGAHGRIPQRQRAPAAGRALARMWIKQQNQECEDC